LQILTHRYTLPALFLAIVAVFWLFTANPQWDLEVAKMVFVDGQFVADRGGLVHQLRMLFWNLSLLVFIAAVLAVSLAHSYAWPRRVLPVRAWNVVLWGFLLGPGILVNVILKGFSQRARPVDLLSFGGDRFYAPIGQFSGQCARDCSFVSGEVSGTTAFCLAGVIMIQHHRARLGPKMARLLYAMLALIFVFVFGHRVLSGGHFMSDALLAGLLTALVFVFVAALWPQDPQSGQHK
jgi:lipid A 4'-phosphatase